MVESPAPAPPRRPLSQRLQPLVDVLYKLLVATAAAIAVWKGLR